jgi:hypothetical protein
MRGRTAQRLAGLAVQHAAAGHDQRTPGAQQKLAARASSPHRRRAAHMQHGRMQEVIGAIEGLGLHVLRQRQAHRAAVGRVGQHLDRARQRVEDLLGPDGRCGRSSA